MDTGARFLLGEFAIYSQSLLIDASVTGRGSHGLGYGHIYVRYLSYVTARTLEQLTSRYFTWRLTQMEEIILQNSTESRKMRKIKSLHNFLLL